MPASQRPLVPYDLTVQEREGYVHATVVGERTPANSAVEASIDDAAMPYFAETVAKKRGVDVRLFQDVAAAARWLRGEDEAQ